MGLIDGKLSLLFYTSFNNDSNTRTEEVWLAHPQRANNLREWEARMLAIFPTGSDDPHLSDDGKVVVFLNKTEQDPSRKLGISHLDPQTLRFTKPVSLFVQINDHFSGPAASPLVRHTAQGLLLFVPSQDSALAPPRRIFRVDCTVSP